jgi:hypothetical protein
VRSELHGGLQVLLGEDQGEGETDDGLEAGVYFGSGAERRLIFGSRRFAYDTHLTYVSLELSKGAVFYLTTDGLIDQVGGPRHRSLGKKHFRAFVAGHEGWPMPEQAQVLRQTLAAYQGDQARRGDVTVLGCSPLSC